MKKLLSILLGLAVILSLAGCSNPEELEKEKEQEAAKQVIDEQFGEGTAEKIIESAKNDLEIIEKQAKDAIPFKEGEVLFKVEYDNETDTENFKMPKGNVRVTAEMSGKEDYDFCGFRLRREGVNTSFNYEIGAYSSKISTINARGGEYYLELYNSLENKCELTIETVASDYVSNPVVNKEGSLFTVLFDTTTGSQEFDLPQGRIEARIEMTNQGDYAWCNFDLYDSFLAHNHMFDVGESNKTTFRVDGGTYVLQLSTSSNNKCTLSFHEIE